MSGRDDWKEKLKADPVDWLLEENDPGVRYLALQDIVEAGETERADARIKAYRDGPIGTILENMEPEGWWVRPGAGYGPKCQGTVWSLISLAELGASVNDDERVAAACSYYLDHAFCRGGQISGSGNPVSTANCLQGNMLTSLMDMGVRDDRLDAAYEWMARTVIFNDLPRKLNGEGQDAETGKPGPYRILDRYGPQFACRTNKYLPCGWSAVKVMMAFSRLPSENRSELIDKAIDIGVDFFLSGDPSKADFPGHRTGVPDKRWWQFRFPSFWGSDILQIAEVFTALGYGNDRRLANTFELILGKQDENGRWPLDWVDRSHKMWVKYGTPGKPNKWVTLRAVRLLKRVSESST
ncbi:MAG: nitrogen fixation protein NifH [Dehalococcoidales bacterium]|nr:nitrogen fixation protein NifH [Dehalococcoidales bacterium]